MEAVKAEAQRTALTTKGDSRSETFETNKYTVKYDLSKAPFWGMTVASDKIEFHKVPDVFYIIHKFEIREKSDNPQTVGNEAASIFMEARINGFGRTTERSVAYSLELRVNGKVYSDFALIEEKDHTKFAPSIACLSATEQRPEHLLAEAIAMYADTKPRSLNEIDPRNVTVIYEILSRLDLVDRDMLSSGSYNEEELFLRMMRKLLAGTELLRWSGLEET